MDKNAEKNMVESGNFDYTEWQRSLFQDMSLEELNEKAAAYARDNHTPAPGVKII